MKTHNLKKTIHTINLRKLTKPTALCISVLFIISILSVFSSSAVQAATVTSFGNTAIGTYTDQNDANAQSISYFKATTTGSITDIIAYIDGATSGKAIAALYAVNGNSAGTLLKQSNAVNIGTTFSWVDFQLITPYSVTSGTTYGLAIMGNVPVNLVIVAGSGQRTGGPGSGSYANGFTNPFGTIWFNDLTGAMSIYAASTSSATPTPTPSPTSTPTPTKTPTPTNTPASTNLAPIPSGWGNGNYGSGVQITHLDYSVEHTSGSPSIRIDAHTSADPNTGRELDSNWFAVKPGDHIVFSAWIKTGHSTLGSDNIAGYGALIGFDCYGSTGNMFEWDGVPNNQPGNTPGLYDPLSWCPYGPNSPSNGLYVPWNSDWTYKVIDCYIPATVPDYYHTPNLFNGGTPTQRPVTGIIPWFMAATYIEPPNNSQDQGIVWVADAQLYINP